MSRAIFIKPIAVLQPSQLFISKEKLENILSSIDFSGLSNIPTILIKAMRGELVMTDGHTRALAAYLAGLDRLPVYWEEDTLDWEAYRVCVAWCKAAGILSPADLADRVVSPDQYQILWLDRCQEMRDKLAEKRSGNNQDQAT